MGALTKSFSPHAPAFCTSRILLKCNVSTSLSLSVDLGRVDFVLGLSPHNGCTLVSKFLCWVVAGGGREEAGEHVPNVRGESLIGALQVRGSFRPPHP